MATESNARSKSRVRADSRVRAEAADRDPPGAVRSLERFAQLVAVSSLALLQPALDVTARNAELLVTRRADVLQAIGLVAVLMFVPAGVWWLITSGVGRWNKRAGRLLHAVGVGGFVALFALGLMSDSSAIPLIWLLIPSVAVGALFGRFVGHPKVREALRFLVVAPLVFALVFFAFSPARTALFGGSSAGAQVASAPTRVLLVVFDELPLASLLDGSGAIDAELFPNFAALGATSTWYRNTTTVAGFTAGAVPAIFTGRYPADTSALPTSRAYDDSLFTMLAASHRLNVHESVTDLCGLAECGEERRDFAGLFGDVARLWWDGLLRHDSTEAFNERDAAAFAIPTAQRFTESIVGGDGPTLDVAHIELPHYPWRRLGTLQDTHAVDELPGESYSVWPTAIGATTGRIRHLLQTQAADTVLGDIVRALEATGEWDDTLVAVVADHGASFTTGQPVRNPSADNLDQIAWVPMFVKYPSQTAGVVDDRPAETVDLVPTIASVEGVDDPPGFDGHSLRDDAAPRERRLYPWVWLPTPLDAAPPDGSDHLTIDDSEFASVLDARAAEPGGEVDLRVFRHSVYGPLIGTPLDRVTIGTADSYTASIEDIAQFDSIDPDADDVRFVVDVGRVVGVDTPIPLALALNGTIVAVTESLPPEAGGGEFVFVVPPSLVRSGANYVTLYRLDGLGPSMQLHPIEIAR